MADDHSVVRMDAVSILEAQDLYRFYHSGDEEVLALRGVTLSVQEGEVVAVMGPSGSGKSTLLACITGLDDPDGGTVRIGGELMSRRPEAEKAARRARQVGVLLSSDNLVGHLTVRQNLGLALRLARRNRSARPDGRDPLERVGLSARAHAYPGELSGGEAVRAGLAVAMANCPSVLVADEPTAQVDSVTERGLLELLRGEGAAGTAVVVSTHSSAVAAAADRVITLADGQVVGR